MDLIQERLTIHLDAFYHTEHQHSKIIPQHDAERNVVSFT